MDYIDKERHGFEDWQDRQRKQIEKVWVILDLTNREPLTYREEDEALDALDGLAYQYPECSFELGWCWQTDVCSDFDYMSSSKVFNSVLNF